ncbi:MAG: hypothetical protein J6O49_11540 [Bacteroidaceae bacterium]|nr:hypothetical protein [Bacteroidaceae bacterium]
MIQIENTLNYLWRLEESGHEGPVIIITKGDLTKFPSDRKFNLDLHFGLSTFGVDSKYDGGNMERFKRNLEYAKELGYKYSIEFRPIIKDINSSKEIIENVLTIASEHRTGVGYCGLQMSDTLKEQLKAEGIEFQPFPGHEFGMKKYVGKEVTDIFDEHSKLDFLDFRPSFKKTSCLIAWKHNLERDPNAHYYRPNEVGCFHCPMYRKCMKFKENLTGNIDIELPFEYDVVQKDNYTCGLVKAGICKFPSDDCKHISGKLIRIQEPITTTDVRIMKWLTGYTVEATFVESPFMSKKWLKV